MRLRVAIAAVCTVAALLAAGCGGSSGRGGSSGPRQARPAASTTTPSSSQTLNCFHSPGACGYPDPAYNNVGVSNCSSLASFTPADLPNGTYYYSGSGNVLEIESTVTISGYNMGNWQIQVGANNVTFDHDCLTHVGNNTSSQNAAIYVTGRATGLTVENSTIKGANNTTQSAEGLVGGGTKTVINNDIFENASDPLTVGTGSTVENSYFLVNTASGGSHAEAIYASNASVTVIRSTLLNQLDQTADVFMDSNTSCDDTLRVTGSLLAGGGYLVYPCAGSTSAGTGGMDIANNTMARCVGTSTSDSSLGGHYCAGNSTPDRGVGTSTRAGADTHGYWPNGGFFGPVSDPYCGDAGWTWSGNVWDDNGSSVPC